MDNNLEGTEITFNSLTFSQVWKDAIIWALSADENKHKTPQPDIMHRMKDLAIVSVKWYVSIKSLSQLRDPCERVGIKSVKSREDRRHKGKKKNLWNATVQMHTWIHRDCGSIHWPTEVCTCTGPLHTYYGFQVCLLIKFLSVWMSKFQLFLVSLCSVPSVTEDTKSYKNVVINSKTGKKQN